MGVLLYRCKNRDGVDITYRFNSVLLEHRTAGQKKTSFRGITGGDFLTMGAEQLRCVADCIEQNTASRYLIRETED